MKNRKLQKEDNIPNRSGIVLLVTLVLLVVLSTLGYTISTRIAAQRHRDHYMIDYQSARYACDSAIKLALTVVADLTPTLVSRPNEPDFSDLFSLTEEEYLEFVEAWAQQDIEYGTETFNIPTDSNNVNAINDITTTLDQNSISAANDISSFDNIDDLNSMGLFSGIVPDINEPNMIIRGPYGPTWPLVTEPIEFEIAAAKVKIEIEDENAKYPIGWAMLKGEDNENEAIAGFELFCEWMKIDELEISELQEQLEDVRRIKQFKLNLKPITKKVPIKTKTSKSSKRGRRRRGRTKSQPTKKTTISVSSQIADFAKLFHSANIDTEILARPTVISDTRKESALKYMGMWASRKVNINTAPRHVLEAAFIFGGDQVEIAEQIITQRRIKPFTNITELKQGMFEYSNSIDKSKKYITTVSSFFTVRVTATCGIAKTTAVIAVVKTGKRVERIAVIGG